MDHQCPAAACDVNTHSREAYRCGTGSHQMNVCKRQVVVCVVRVCVFALICIRKREQTKRERERDRQSKTSVKHELCKSHQARSEFTEQQAQHNLYWGFKVFFCSVDGFVFLNWGKFFCSDMFYVRAQSKRSFIQLLGRLKYCGV